MKKHVFGSFSRKLNSIILFLVVVAFLSAYWTWLDKPPLLSIPWFLFLASVCLLLVTLQTKQVFILGSLFETFSWSRKKRVDEDIRLLKSGWYQLGIVLFGLFLLLGSQTQTGWYSLFLIMAGLVMVVSGLYQFVNREKLILEKQSLVKKKK
ncbi:MAG: hypothetical protein FJY86_04130 [Candidatus Diapherotrites archaeon]|uniref:2TM domain-containing protein n=1 Tax=Candidatus Iainarchaeum sp. TaxID=3101447 RepID=A0A8T4C852_9ARCH|nr:hypothetical protein [Candidatus Diapherotrites archaeon]